LSSFNIIKFLTVIYRIIALAISYMAVNDDLLVSWQPSSRSFYGLHNLSADLGKARFALHGGNELGVGNFTIAISVGVVETIVVVFHHLILPHDGFFIDMSLQIGQCFLLLSLDLLFDDFVELFLADDTITV